MDVLFAGRITTPSSPRIESYEFGEGRVYKAKINQFSSESEEDIFHFGGRGWVFESISFLIIKLRLLASPALLSRLQQLTEQLAALPRRKQKSHCGDPRRVSQNRQ
jgi:hypothetical protein